MSKNREQRKQQIKEAIKKIREASNGNWVSVKDEGKSISVICKNAGLDTNWTSALVKCLREQTDFGMVDGMLNGNASGIRYKFPSDYSRDLDYLVEKVIINYDTKEKTPSKDLSNFTNKSEKPKGGKAEKTKRTHIDIDSICFYLDTEEGKISEVEVTSVSKLEVDDKMKYFHTIKCPNGGFIYSVPNTKLFENVDQLLNCLKFNVIKFTK